MEAILSSCASTVHLTLVTPIVGSPIPLWPPHFRNAIKHFLFLYKTRCYHIDVQYCIIVSNKYSMKNHIIICEYSHANPGKNELSQNISPVPTDLFQFYKIKHDHIFISLILSGCEIKVLESQKLGKAFRMFGKISEPIFTYFYSESLKVFWKANFLMWLSKWKPKRTPQFRTLFIPTLLVLETISSDLTHCIFYFHRYSLGATVSPINASLGTTKPAKTVMPDDVVLMQGIKCSQYPILPVC